MPKKLVNRSGFGAHLKNQIGIGFWCGRIG